MLRIYNGNVVLGAAFYQCIQMPNNFLGHLFEMLLHVNDYQRWAGHISSFAWLQATWIPALHLN